MIVSESMRIHCPYENGRAAFSDFSTLRPIFKKMRFQDPCGQSAKMIQYMCIFVWTASKVLSIDLNTSGKSLTANFKAVIGPTVQQLLVSIKCVAQLCHLKENWLGWSTKKKLQKACWQ